MRGRKRHFDDVINDYKEFEVHDYEPLELLLSRDGERNGDKTPERGGQVKLAFDHLARAFGDEIRREEGGGGGEGLDWLPPHAILYPPSDPSEQQLKPHVDSVRFSGKYVCGYTVQGGDERLLRLKWDDHGCDGRPVSHPLRDSVDQITIPLNTNSGYILSGPSRYLMTHEVVGGGVEDRIAVILRDVLEEDRVKFGMDDRSMKSK